LVEFEDPTTAYEFCFAIILLEYDAGPDGPTKLCNLQSTDIDFVLSLNVSAPMKLVNLCLPYMISGGRILNVTSRAGSLAIPDGAAYCLTKAALDMYTRCLSLELKERGISAAAVIPGEVDTDMQLVWRVTDCDLQGWFTKNKAESLLIAPQVTAKFFAYLLCDLDATVYNSHDGPFSIYDKEHHSHWKLEEDLVPSVF
jgi:NAD(P)-dependent dehydrogenase (short-subunit alcohol dehydrogenase family)